MSFFEEMESRIPKGKVRTRFAPSPTGYMHVGNLRTALYTWLIARSQGGTFILRIEDTDQGRLVEGAVDVIYKTLAECGLDHDEGPDVGGPVGPYVQSERRGLFGKYAELLVQKGGAYYCFCQKEAEPQESAEDPKQIKKHVCACRDMTPEAVQEKLAAGAPYVIRQRIPHEGTTTFHDASFGDITVENKELEDQVLLKSDGIPTYHFAHAVDDHLMRTTHVVRGDEWLPSLPFHIQLFQALGFKLPKYVHIGPLMKMDGSSKRKLSKRKDPELALTYYKAEGFPIPSVREYIMTVLNSNFEDWRRANPDADIESFKFSPKKLNPAGSLFDYAKLVDVSKNVISRMTAEDVYAQLLEWAKEFDSDFAAKLEADPDYAKRILAIGRGGKKPRKDLAVWKDAKPYMGFFYDEYLEAPVWDEKFSKTVIRDVLERFLNVYDFADDSAAWFAKVKEITEAIGFTTDMKAYKANPAAFPGTVADVSTFLRQAVTGKTDSPDLYTIMQILGYGRTVARIRDCISQL